MKHIYLDRVRIQFILNNKAKRRTPHLYLLHLVIVGVCMWFSGVTLYDCRVVSAHTLFQYLRLFKWVCWYHPWIWFCHPQRCSFRCILQRGLLDVELLVRGFYRLKFLPVDAVHFFVNIQVQQRDHLMQYYVGHVSLV